MEEIFLSAFRQQLVHHRVPGRYTGMLFPTSTKTRNSHAGIGVGFIALEWPGRGSQYMPVLLADEMSTFDVRFVYLFKDLYI